MLLCKDKRITEREYLLEGGTYWCFAQPIAIWYLAVKERTTDQMPVYYRNISNVALKILVVLASYKSSKICLTDENWDCEAYKCNLGSDA